MLLPQGTTVVTIYDTFKTSSMLPNKDTIPTDLASNVVYKYQCEHCQRCYIGETKRHLCVRVKEHLTGKPEKTEINLHEHSSTSRNFTILTRSRFTKIAEAVYISRWRTGPHQKLLNIQHASLPLFLF